MYKKIKQFCEDKNLIQSGDKIVIGLSGGADSICLLLILNELKNEIDFNLEAITINHQLRIEADNEIAFVESLCDKLRIPLTKEVVDVRRYQEKTGLGTEEAARILRYEIFDKEIEKGAKIALAHHQNDQAETVLFHMFRGSDMKGLKGMDAKRDSFIRPLLCVTRDEIEQYLKLKAQPYVTDRSNFDTVYSRNYIRHELLTRATERICENSIEHICDMAESVGQAVDYLNLQINDLFDKFVERKEDIYLRIKKSDLLYQHPYMISSLCYEMLTRFCGKKKDITKKHVDSLIELCKGQSGKKVDLIYGMKAYTDQTWLYVGCDEDKKECSIDKREIRILKTDFENKKDLKIDYANHTFSFRVFPYESDMIIPDGLYTKWFDYDKIVSSLSIRNRQLGDYIYYNDEKKQKCKDFFINEKISLLLRDEIPLIAEEDHILWIVGYRISNFYKITDQTKMILEIQEEYHG